MLLYRLWQLACFSKKKKIVWHCLPQLVQKFNLLPDFNNYFEQLFRILGIRHPAWIRQNTHETVCPVK